jgi:hypothetical protein
VNVASILLWGFAATLALTSVMSVGHGLGLTRMSIPFLLGTMLTPNRDRALVVGVGFHMVNGWLFALLYGMWLEAMGRATWWLGAVIGLGHALFVLAVAMPILPGFHPHMVSEYYGPTPNRRLQPPGFLALNYGKQTPIVTVVAHLLYGAIIGGFYELASLR